MPGRALTPTPKTYAQLRAAVIAVVGHGRREIDRAWLFTYHETGRLINEHVLLFRDRADYGTQTFEQLARDSGISVRTLRQCAQFQRYYPMRHTCAELEWSKCRLLCEVSDAGQREKLRVQTLKHDWTAADLEARVRACNATAREADETKISPAPALLTPRRGTPGLHPIVDRGDGPAVDLGFKLYRAPGPAAKLQVGDIVRLDDAGMRRVAGATPAELFTYTATIRRVIDGDTLLVALLVAPDITLELKLRLRGLDCLELSTTAGRAAKRFVDGLLRAGDEVILSTTKPDKYDRYLADVFVGAAVSEKLGAESPRPNDPAAVDSVSPLSTFNAQRGAHGTGVFLNNALLEAGHALRYDGVGPKDG